MSNRNRVSIELEEWLRKEAKERLINADSRRTYARAGLNCTAADRKMAHMIAEQMSGRKLPKTSKAIDKKNSLFEERIASKLEQEAAMLQKFADFVRDSGS